MRPPISSVRWRKSSSKAEGASALAMIVEASGEEAGGCVAIAVDPALVPALMLSPKNPRVAKIRGCGIVVAPSLEVADGNPTTRRSNFRDILPAQVYPFFLHSRVGVSCLSLDRKLGAGAEKVWALEG